ncbi:MAG: PLDc_N domain-containing protein, partial [Clostridia bacterium]|nr:PLDc_N domain-containing protein [Clostridia bacterium]
MKLSHRISRFLRQRILVVLIILLQIAFVTVALVRNTRNWELLAVLFGAISFFVALYVVNSRDQAAYKTTLVFLILCFPIFGGLFYILFKGTVPHRAMHKKLLALEEQLARQNAFFSSARDEAVRDHPDRAGQIRYLCDHAGFPVVKN